MSDGQIMAAIVVVCALIALIIGYVTQRVINTQLQNANGELSRKLRRAEGTERRLKVAQPMRGGGEGMEPPSPCPLCTMPVGVAHEVQLIEDDPGEELRPYLVRGRSSTVVQTVVTFGPCGCRWESNAYHAKHQRAYDLVCTMNGPGGFQFAEVLREDKEPGQIVRRTAGAAPCT